MKAEIKDIILIEGRIKDISFNENKEKVLIKFEKSDIVLDFRNGKKKRADIIKKMNLKCGEKIIAIGKKSKGSLFYAFGWDIKRYGFLKQGKYSLFRGQIMKIDDSPAGDQILHLMCEHRIFLIKVPIQKLDQLSITGCSDLTALCYSFKDSGCLSCKTWMNDRCNICKKRNSVFSLLEFNGG